MNSGTGGRGGLLRAPSAPTQSPQSPRTPLSAGLDVLTTLQSLVNTPAPAAPADPVLSALQALIGVQAPASAASAARTSFDATAPRAPLTQPLLPNSVSPPTDERLTRCFLDAWRSAHGDTKLATSQERTELLNLARKLRGEGKNATEIEYTLLAKLKETAGAGGVSGQDPAAVREAVTEAFKSVFGRAPSSSEHAHWMKEADKLAKEGKDARTIQYALMTPMQQARDGGDKTDDDALRQLITAAFREVLGGAFRPPTAREQQEWLKLARKLRDEDKQGALAISYMLSAEVRIAYSNL